MLLEQNPYVGVIEVQGPAPEAGGRPSSLKAPDQPAPSGFARVFLGRPSSLLAKTPSLEVRRLALAEGQEIPTHHATGEITVHCLEGSVRFTAGGTSRDLKAGQLLVLAAGEPHSLVGLKDSTVLVTKVRPTAGATA